ncbi:hypothetical protein ABZP36_027290 [Zizania latifolia]
MDTIPLLIPLFVLAVVSLTVAAGDDVGCPGAPSMSVEAACRKACGTQLMYDVCRDALRDVPDPSASHDVTEYALAAARGALASEAATMDVSIQLLYNASISGDEKAAYMECVQSYTAATEAISNVQGNLPICSFDGLAADYKNGLLHLENCRDRVIKLAASPLYAMVLVDRNKAVLAFFLGQLLGI